MSDTPIKHHVSIDMLQNAILNAILHPLTADPGSPANFQVWTRSDEQRIKVKLPASTEQFAFMSDITAGGISGDLYDANTLLKADADNTPVAMTVAPSTMVGRTAGGNIAALTAAEVSTILGLPGGTVANQSYVDAAIAALADTAPAALDTLNELAAALGDDANFSTTVFTALANRLQAYSATIGDAAATTFALTHGFTREVSVEVFDEATGEKVQPGISIGAGGSVQATINFGAAPAANEFRAVIHGKP